ncbi:restriction endonuclease [Microvirga sp. BT688]|uniref:restriction endonuclease n=1 Tax=Microvirga sp. TaxID=1873136 RepID=UPI00168972CF|nr:restriction endonuclease [Microvirga sp.]MBD2750668.1 restriction endonuclease [Microvirga sp.]
MFRYLWRHKAFSAVLLLLFGMGLYLHPIAAWAGLALLLFLRLTKVHSLLLIYDLTDRAAIKHIRTLATKRAHMLSPDEYGNISEEAWDKHLNTFIKKTLLPEFQRRKVDHFFAKDPRRSAARLRTRINRIIDWHQPAGAADEVDNTMTGREFELYCRDVLQEAGWQAALTPGSGDQGADIIAEKDGRRVVIQCKFYNGTVGNKAVQEAYAAAAFQDAPYAVVVTNSVFTKSAHQLAHKNGVLLMHHSDLERLDLIVTSGAGSR